MTKPHVHAALIKQWADGAEIQWYNNVTGEWESNKHHAPCWDATTKYRVKPEPKPDVVKYMYIDEQKHTNASRQADTYHNVMFVFDGETGKLKDAQVLAHV